MTVGRRQTLAPRHQSLIERDAARPTRKCVEEDRAACEESLAVEELMLIGDFGGRLSAKGILIGVIISLPVWCAVLVPLWRMLR